MAKQYRPYLTLAELQSINQALQSGASAIQNAGLIRYLNRFIQQIESGTREANNILAPTIEQKLGLDDSSSESSDNSASPLRFSSAELYNQWRNNIPLTPAQIQAALSYAYQNDLMTPAEERAYEQSQGRMV